MEKVKTILNIIGSPFNSPENIELDHDSTRELYSIAQKNKIGLLFLEALSQKKKIDLELYEELKKQRERYKTLRITAERAAGILNNFQFKYAIVKSTYSFQVVTADVDIIIFGRKDEYRKAVDKMTGAYFELMADAPLECMLHDKRGSHGDPLAKDPFDVDLYREIGAGHIIYLNKEKFLHHLEEINSNGIRLKVLDTACELALNIFHAIYPEKLFTLLLHYHILYAIKEMTTEEIESFIRICSDHRISNAVLLALSLTETIQELFFGESPYRLTSLRDAFGKKQIIKIGEIPYNFSYRTVLNCFWHKRNDLLFTKSVFKQAIFMLNPRYARFVLRILKERQQRDTY